MSSIVPKKRMQMFSLLLFLSALMVEDSYAITCSAAPVCLLFPNQTNAIVSLQELTQKVQSKHWILIYYSEFSNKQTGGKCNFRWNAPDSDQNVYRELMCYNYDMEGCDDYALKVKRMSDDCGRASERNGTSQMLLNAKFYSQNLDQYFWYDACYEYNDAQDCTTRYLGLLVSKDRYPHIDGKENELDLQGLPWHQIVSDLKKHFDMDMSDEKMKFNWKGPECGFDGKIIQETNTASGGEMNFVALFLFLIKTFIF